MNKEYKSSAFDDPDIEGPNNSKLKLDASKSRFFRKNDKKEQTRQLEEKVAEVQNNNDKNISEAMELATKFISLIKTKTLKENKSAIEESLEAEIINKLVQFSLKLNNDENQPEGIGSIGAIKILLKSVLLQRDIINKLEYKIVQLEKQINNLSSNKL